MDGEQKSGLIPVHTVFNPSKSTNINAIPFGFRLSDSNFKVWSKMMEVHASGLGKLRYLTRKIPVIGEDDSGYARWSTEDAIVRGWLLKTIEAHLLGLFIDLPTAKDIWESVTQMFYDGSDESQGNFFNINMPTPKRRKERSTNISVQELIYLSVV